MRYWLIALMCFFPALTQGSVILISDRCQFTDPDKFCPNQVKKRIVFQAPYKTREITDDQWKSLIKDKSVLVVLHGYNNDYEEALKFFSEIDHQYSKLYDTIICYLWPGGDNFWEYFQAKFLVRANDLPQEVLALLEATGESCAHLDAMGHSMGCRLVLQALLLPSAVHLRNLFLMAPAVDNESLGEGEVYFPALAKCRDAYVFYSRRDGVLKWVYLLAEWDRSLGARGPQDRSMLPKNVHLIDSTDQVSNHSGYSGSIFVYQLISNLIQVPQISPVDLVVGQ